MGLDLRSLIEFCGQEGVRIRVFLYSLGGLGVECGSK
jgi:hypothetical protein